MLHAKQDIFSGDVTFSVVGASTVEMTWNSDLVANVGMYTNAGTYDPQFTMSVSLGTEAIPALASGPEGRIIQDICFEFIT